MLPFLIRIFENVKTRNLSRQFSHLSIRKNTVLERKRSNLEIWQLTQSCLYSSKSMKVAILGAASKTGNCLSLFLKQSCLIDELAIYDTRCTYGLALDLNYIDTRCKVSTCNSSEQCLQQTLEGAKIVMMIADRVIDKKCNPVEISKRNADTLSDLLPYVVKFCPRAMVAVAMDSVNSLIPLAAEMYKRAGINDYNRLFGVISLNCIRANTFAAEVLGVEAECVMVPIIGGNCSNTCVPVFSQSKPCNKMSQNEAYRLTQAVKSSDEEILKRMKNNETPFFATAFAAARFCVSLCKALRHKSGVVECAYVRSCVIPDLTYFAAPLELGPDGVQKHLGIPPLNDTECKLLKAAIPALKKDIAIGEALALGQECISSKT